MMRQLRRDMLPYRDHGASGSTLVGSRTGNATWHGAAQTPSKMRSARALLFWARDTRRLMMARYLRDTKGNTPISSVLTQVAHRV
ncbi:hypothetical protein MTO96_012378 [Rhipicephalus appendiculatus]